MLYSPEFIEFVARLTEPPLTHETRPPQSRGQREASLSRPDVLLRTHAHLIDEYEGCNPIDADREIPAARAVRAQLGGV